MGMPSSILRRFAGPVQILGAGLFCFQLGLFLGNKLIAAGQVLLVLGLILSIRKGGWQAASRSELPHSALCLGLFLLFSVVSVMANWSIIEEPLDHLKKLRYLALFLALLVLSGHLLPVLSDRRMRNGLAWACLGSMALTIGIGLVALWLGEHPLRSEEVADERRLSGLYGQVMTFAYTLQFPVIALAAFLFSPTLWKRMTSIPRWVVPVLLLLGGLGLYLTYTRGAMLGVVVGFMAYGMLRSKWLVLLVLVIGIGAGTYAYREQARYFKANNTVRVNQWKAASLAFVERPLFGWGYRNFEVHSADLKERYGFEKDRRRKVEGQRRREAYYFQGHAHNNYLEAFASTGIPGGLAFLAFCAYWVAEASRSRYRLLFLPLILAFLVSGFFENTFFDSEVLNAILLIYLFSQILFREERRAAGHDPIQTADPPSAG